MKNKIRKCLFLATALLNFLSLGMQAQQKQDMVALPDKVIEAQKNGNIKLADSLAQVYIKGYLFKLKDRDVFTKDHLTFMNDHLNDTENKAFKLFLKYPEKVNAVLGKDKAQYALRGAIVKAYFQGIDPIKKPNFDWTALEKIMTSKFGEMGIETLYSNQMRYHLRAKDWDNFGKYYVLYFERAFKRPEYDINSVTWPLFENVSDPKVLRFACDVVMKYAIDVWYQDDLYAYDTYANLLYKTDRKEQAIEWEEKAVKLSKNDEGLVQTLEKMRNNIQTWPETAAKP